MTVIFLQIILLVIILKAILKRRKKPNKKQLDTEGEKEFNQILTFEELLEDEGTDQDAKN